MIKKKYVPSFWEKLLFPKLTALAIHERARAEHWKKQCQLMIDKHRIERDASNGLIEACDVSAPTVKRLTTEVNKSRKKISTLEEEVVMLKTQLSTLRRQNTRLKRANK